MVDEKVHGFLLRPIANAFALSNLVGCEPLVDKKHSTFHTFLNEMDNGFLKTGAARNLGDWLQMHVRSPEVKELIMAKAYREYFLLDLQ